jgi:ubiquinol-cytochrome c reductase cytochrome b subunit
MKMFDWLDHRTGFRKLTREGLFENIPGGSRWRYVWGSTLTFTFVVQIITGIFLWMAYSPSAQTAWESVFYIQEQMAGGWLLRGIHHYTAHAMTVLLVLHLMQVVIDGAYKAPREINFWFGVVLLLLVLGLSLTGYLLPWDQKGYWATKVATNLVGITPFIGTQLQSVIMGGSDYGHHTLTRFFALHAGVLPGLIIILIAGHIYLFRRHGITAKQPLRRRDEKFWPEQVLKDVVACLAVLATVLFLIAWKGAELGAPADPAEPYNAARPDWYFLFLFQFLKYFPGSSEIWGAIIIPSAVIVVIALMPFIGRWKLGHRFNVGFLWVLVVGAGLLTYLAIAEDKKNPDYEISVRAAEKESARVKELAKSPKGIPVFGATTLLREDAFTQGPKLFAAKCASCHRFNGHDGLENRPKDTQSAPDLASVSARERRRGFASREWLADLLNPELIASTNYFGGTKFAEGKMAKFVKRDVAGFNEQQRTKLKKVILALSAEAKLKSQTELDQQDAKMIEEGRILIADPEMRCTECHQFHKRDEDATGPDLTGYGSREWLINFISNPAQENFYGKRNDRMPAFGTEGILTDQEIVLLVDWLRGEWYEPPQK